MTIPRINTNGYQVPIYATRPRPQWSQVWVQRLDACWGYRQACWACGGQADYMVGRTSGLTDRQYSDPACSRCAGDWAMSDQCIESEHPDRIVVREEYRQLELMEVTR